MKPIKDMDYMDVDQVVDVPDTPDRLATQNTNGRGFMEKESDSSVASHSGNTDFIEEGARNQLRARKKLVIDNGHSSRPSFHLGKKLGISHKSERGDVFTISPGNSSSSKSHNLFRRMAADKNANHENKKYSHCEPKEKGKGLCASQSSTFVGNDVVDLMEHSGHAQVLQKAFPNRASEGRQIKETRKGPISVNGFSPSRGIANPSTVAHIPYKGKEKLDGACKEGPGIDRGKGIVVDSQPKAGKSMSASLYSIPPPRARGQKRLVRNGCISPHSPAKAKQLVENPSNSSSDVQNDMGAPVSDCSSSLIRELIAEDNNSHRRKGVLRNLFSSEELDTKTTNYSTRHSLTRNEEAGGTSNANGWRSTHNHTKQVNLPLYDEGQHFSQTKSDQCFVTPQNNNSTVRRDNGNGSSIRLGNNHHDGTNAVSSQHGSAPTVSHLLNSDQVSGHFTTASSLIKRQKQSSASSNRRETSTSVSMDSEIVFLGSSGEPSNSRSTNNQNSRRILDPIIEIEEFSPERRRGSRNIGRSSDPDSRSRARQLEADEMLARELQEQLYNEGPGVADGEIDAHIALALQQEETSQYAFSNGSPPIFRPRAPVISNFNRQSQTRTSQYPSIRRGTQVRGRASTRLTRLRSRLPPSQSTRISHGERRSIFAPGLDLDTRMHILETLEAFSDMGVTGNFLQAEHEFNVNDYETLLALDENNHQHGGASLNQINILPESTVQGDNYDETCAICLETPTTGDAIRHLPCLHKFHKDCIDPWLRRRPSCPVCKFSITS